MIGQTLAHYNILGKLGSGGMGDVYLAEDTKLNRKVALKVLPPELAGRGRARFEREAKAIAALDHPNIVQVFSVEEAAGIHFITMQLVQGKTLTQLLPRNGFPLGKFFDITIPLADAVAAAHQEGITHRDLKPDNVMVSDDGRVKVLDFGLAKPEEEPGDTEGDTIARTRAGQLLGTPAYMSPEQARGGNRRCPLRHLLIRHALLSDAERKAAVSRQDGRREDRGDSQGNSASHRGCSAGARKAHQPLS